MSPYQLKRLFPNASQGVLQANACDYGKPNFDLNGAGKTPKLERPDGHGSLAAPQAQEANPERVLIRFVSVRKRLLDPDNLSEKWLLDCLRYCGIIRGDEPEKITLETTQRKCQKCEAEHTEISIFSR